MKTRVILIVKQDTAKQAYLKALEPLDVKVDTASSFKELHQFMEQTRYNGILVDLITKIKTSGAEIAWANEVLEQFPVIQLKWDPKASRINTLLLGQSKGLGDLDYFIKEQCRRFSARPIRTDVRKKVHFNVILNKSELAPNKGIPTITMDVSKGGCFIYTVAKHELNAHVLFTIKELSDPKPINGEVRWKRPWGAMMEIPGIGIQFTDLSNAQLENIKKQSKLK